MDSKKSLLLLKNNKYFFLLLIGLFVGALMLFWGGTDGKQSEADRLNEDERYDMIEYCSYLEDKVKNLCENVSGVSDVRSIVTLAGGFENQYAKDSKLLTVGSGVNQVPVTVQKLFPEIKGIGIVCTGGNDPVVQKEISSLLCAAFDVPLTRIYVTGSDDK